MRLPREKALHQASFLRAHSLLYAQSALVENLFIFQKGDDFATVALFFKATNHMLDGVGLATCHPGIQENRGKACSGHVCQALTHYPSMLGESVCVRDSSF